MQKIYLNWDDIQKDTMVLANKIKEYGNFDKIIAVSRGGLIPAGIIGYALNIRHIETVNIESYDGNKQRNVEDITIDIKASNERVLIVDDLSDTGNTFRILRKFFPNALLTCVYTKPEGEPFTDIHAIEMPQKWIVFPWDA